MLSSVVGIALVVYVLGTILKRYLHSKSSLSLVPGPKSQSWIYGSMRELMLGEYGPNMFDWQRLYGPVFRIKSCFGASRLMVADPRTLQVVLNDIDTFPRSVEHRELARLLMGEGIFWAEGKDHRRQRAIMQQCFSLATIKELFPRFMETAQTLIDRWESTVAHEKSTFTVDMCSWAHRASLDVIGSAAFNYAFRSLTDHEDKVAKSYHNLLDDSMTRSSLSIIGDGILSMIPPAVLPCFDYLPSKAMKRLRTNRELVSEFAAHLVQLSTNMILSESEPAKDVLSQIVRANLASDPKLKMSSQEVYAQVSSFILAGEETAADTICWALYELARNPQHQQRVRAEIEEVYTEARNRGDDDIAFSDLERMPFTISFMKEVFRFHPALPMSIRQASKDTVVPLSQPITLASGHRVYELPISKGETVIVNTAGYNRLESVWGPTAQEFDPLRWLDGRKGEVAPYAGMYSNLMTFLGGPRGCIGWRFAITEMQVIIVKLVLRFQFAVPAGVSIRRELALVTIPVVVGDEKRSQQLPLEITPVDVQ